MNEHPEWYPPTEGVDAGLKARRRAALTLVRRSAYVLAQVHNSLVDAKVPFRPREGRQVHSSHLSGTLNRPMTVDVARLSGTLADRPYTMSARASTLDFSRFGVNRLSGRITDSRAFGDLHSGAWVTHAHI
jgi:hypothetical protein